MLHFQYQVITYNNQFDRLRKNSSEISNQNTNIFIQENAFENIVCTVAIICLGLSV